MVNPFRLLQEAGSCTPFDLRELTFLEEQYQRPWAKDLEHVLLEMKAATDAAHTQQGLPHLATAQRLAFVARYQELLAAGYAANPPPERRPKQRGRGKQTPAQNLLERLWLGQGQVLAFLHDLTNPFDNNQAERDLRMLKIQRSSEKSQARPATRVARGRSRAAAAPCSA